MAHVYILYSESVDRYYIGSCFDLNERLEQHNTHHFIRSYTKRASDWKLFLSIDDLSLHEPRAIEYYIKRMKSRKYIEQLRNKDGMIRNLKRRFCGGPDPDPDFKSGSGSGSVDA
ncbi:MAG: GIY-YIG nuclease family protein [Flavobacteriales bacterium]|nr:GIY-YIG nuclease family protein [Flavobacteriales bacterium]